MIGHAGLTEQRQSWALLSGHIIGFSVVAISVGTCRMCLPVRYRTVSCQPVAGASCRLPAHQVCMLPARQL